MPTETGLAEIGSTRPTDLSSKFKADRENLEQKLADIRRAEELLDGNPELKELFDVISRIGHRY